MIELRIDSGSGVPAYLQIVHQVQHALRLGLLQPGDQMPTVRELVGTLAINPNTIMKAYRELEYLGLIGGKPGQGTYVLQRLPGAAQADLDEMRTGLLRWFERAEQLGLDEESVMALFTTTFRERKKGQAA
jgi:GntR family transcriptional regulator